MLTRNSLKNDLVNLGLAQDQFVMLHASARSVGTVLGGPDQIHQAIMDVISPGGTLCMYVGCESEYEVIGRKDLSQEEEEFIFENTPPFVPTSARARHDYGILAEFFRSWPGTLCSVNPGARIAALGPKSYWLTANHPLNYGYGPNSPLAKLYDNDGKILLVGSDHDQVTILHYAEHVAPIENKRIVRFQVPILKNEKRTWLTIEEYDTGIGIRQWPDRFFASIVNEFIQTQSTRPGQVGNAKTYLLDARLLVDFATQMFIDAARKYPV